MSVRIKFGNCVPFPPKPGMYIRFVFADSPEQANSLVITQGQVMMFESEEVILMEKGERTIAKVVMEGDQLCRVNGLVVNYAPIEGVGITRSAGADPKNNGHDTKPKLEP